MKHIIYIIMCVLGMSCIASCSSSRTMASSDTTIQRDSIHIEYRDCTVYVPDYIYVNIPEQLSERTTVDSTSHLETDYAISDVRINPDGTLYHYLKNKPQDKPIEVQTKVVYKDRIIYKNRTSENRQQKTVEKKQPPWTTIKLIGVIVALVGIIVALVVLRIRHIF